MSNSDIICDDCGAEITQGEAEDDGFYWNEDERLRCPKCHEKYMKWRESRKTEATRIENYL